MLVAQLRRLHGKHDTFAGRYVAEITSVSTFQLEGMRGGEPLSRYTSLVRCEDIPSRLRSIAYARTFAQVTSSR